MSRQAPNQQVITSGDMSTASLTSLPSNIGGLQSASYTMVWTGTPTGTWAVQVSNNWKPTLPQDATTGAGTWTTLTLAIAPSAPAGGAGNTGVDLSLLPYQWVRIVYTKTGGTGTLNVFFQGKGV